MKSHFLALKRELEIVSVIMIPSKFTIYSPDGVASDLYDIPQEDCGNINQILHMVKEKIGSNMGNVQVHLCDRSVSKDVPVNNTGKPTQPSFTFFCPGSSAYMLFIKSLTVFNEGKSYNERKLGSISRGSMNVAKLKCLKRQIDIENEERIRMLTVTFNRLCKIAKNSFENM